MYSFAQFAKQIANNPSVADEYDDIFLEAMREPTTSGVVSLLDLLSRHNAATTPFALWLQHVVRLEAEFEGQVQQAESGLEDEFDNGYKEGAQEAAADERRNIFHEARTFLWEGGDPETLTTSTDTSGLTREFVILMQRAIKVGEGIGEARGFEKGDKAGYARGFGSGARSVLRDSDGE